MFSYLPIILLLIVFPLTFLLQYPKYQGNIYIIAIFIFTAVFFLIYSFAGGAFSYPPLLLAIGAGVITVREIKHYRAKRHKRK